MPQGRLCDSYSHGPPCTRAVGFDRAELWPGAPGQRMCDSDSTCRPGTSQQLLLCIGCLETRHRLLYVAFFRALPAVTPPRRFTHSHTAAAACSHTHRYDLQLDFLEAVFGCGKEIEVDRLASCKSCEGSGVKSGTSSSTCPQCGGSGQVVSAVRTPLGTFQQVSVCTRCEGRGQVFTPCETCGGDGRVRESKRISLKVR